MIRGITVILYGETQTGTDIFNRPVFEQTEIPVANVLVTPASAEAIINELSISGKHLVYELCIPKGDANDWEDKEGRFLWPDFPHVRTCRGMDRVHGSAVLESKDQGGAVWLISESCGTRRD